MKRLLNILIFLVLSLVAAGQQETRMVDSLLRAISSQEGENRVVSMSELSRAFEEISFDDCLFYGEKAIVEAERLNDDELIAWTHWKMGIRLLNHFELDLAHDHFEQAYQLMVAGDREVEDVELLMDILNYKGRVELLMGEMDLALITFQQALVVSENLGDEMNCADVINNMAYIHFQQNDLEKAMDYFQDARQRYERAQDTLSMAQCDNNISNIYVERQQYNEALAILRKVIPVFERNGDETSLAHAYQNVGTVYATGQVDLDSAMTYLHRSIICAENIGDQLTLIEDELELAGVLRHLNRENEAISLYQSALHSSEMIGFLNGILESYKNLGIHYNNAGDYTTSAVYLKRCMDLALEKGNHLYVNLVRPYLIADYSHLGHFVEMGRELGLYTENYENIVSESNALDEELARLRDNAQDLLAQYESQNDQIQALQSQRNQYRLALFGLLAIALFALVLLLAYKIVRKKRTKIEKG